MDYSNKTYEELSNILDSLREDYINIEDTCAKDGLPYEEFMEKSKNVKEKLYFVDKYMRLKQAPSLQYNKTWKGDLYMLEYFKDMVNNGVFIDYDGYGYYATENAKSDIVIMPSDIIENIYRDDFTHIIWFNR